MKIAAAINYVFGRILNKKAYVSILHEFWQMSLTGNYMKN